MIGPRLCKLAEPQCACPAGQFWYPQQSEPRGQGASACVSVTFFLCTLHRAGIGAVNKTDATPVERGNYPVNI